MSLKIINPSTGAVIREVELQDARQLDVLIVRARQAFDCGPWPKVSLRERKQFLLKISQGILDQAQELAQLETLNTGKPIKESTFMDVPSAAKCFEYFAHHLEEFLKPEAITISEEATSQLIRQPQGLVALITPWNYPLLIASWKMAQALAAGNTVILKPSSLTPITALELGRIVERAGMPPGVVQVVCSSGSQIGEALVADARVDMVSFTGSNHVGKQILSYSSKQIKKLVMELGGKSATIVLKDADLEVAVNGSLCSAFLNQGQMCTQMSRILVQEEIHDAFVNDFVAKAARIKVGDGMSYETQMGPLISQLQREKVLASVQQAKKEGVKVLCGGVIPDAPELKQGFFFNPTVLAEVTPQMAIFQEEVFGPVVCVSKFSSLEEAVALANNSKFGLANCIWAKDTQLAQQLAQKVNSGTTWINTYGMFYNELPYGGFKESGFGKELGREGFLEYSRLKNIITDNTKDAKPLVNYWYGL